MDCKFRILTKNRETFEKLKSYANGWSEKGLLVVFAKCEFLEELKKFDVEILISPVKSPEGGNDCFYFNKSLKECDKNILKKFDMEKFEPIVWKEMEDKELPF